MAKQILKDVKQGKYTNTEKYARNVGHSFTYYIKDIVKEKLPIYEAYKESDPEDDIKFTKRDLKGKRVFSYLSNITGLDVLFKDVGTAWRNAKTSIRSGRFYDKRRANKAEAETMKGMGLDLDMDELKDLENMDLDKEFDESEDSLDSFGDNDIAQMEKDLDASFRGGADQISEATMSGSEYIAGSIRGASNLAYGQSMKSMKIMGEGFGNLSNQLVSLNKFNQEQIQQHIQNSSQFFTTVSNLLAEQNGMLKEILEMKRNMYEQAKMKSSDSEGDLYDQIISSDGRINFKKFKENFEYNVQNGPFSMIPFFYNMVAKEFAANPIQFLMNQMISSLGGNKVERALEKLQKTMVASLGNLNARLLRAGEEGGILGEILSLFGIREEHTTEIKTEFEKGPMQYNGAANKAITEIIPMYLARIEAALTGGPIKLFDMEKGTWTTSKEVRSNFEKNKSLSGGNVDEIVYDNFRNMAQSDKFYFSENEKKELQRVVTKEIIPNLKKSSAIIDKNNIMEDDGTLTDDFIEAIGIDEKKLSPKLKTMIGMVFKNMPDYQRSGLAGAARADRAAKSELYNKVNADQYSIYRALANGALNGTIDNKYNLEDQIKSVTPINENISISDEISKSRYVLQEIYKELFNLHTTLITKAGVGLGAGIGMGGGSLPIDTDRNLKSFDQFDYNEGEMKPYENLMWWNKRKQREYTEGEIDISNQIGRKYVANRVEANKLYNSCKSELDSLANEYHNKYNKIKNKYPSFASYVEDKASKTLKSFIDQGHAAVSDKKAHSGRNDYYVIEDYKEYFDSQRLSNADKDAELKSKILKKLGTNKEYSLEEFLTSQKKKYAKAKDEYESKNKNKPFMSWEQFLEKEKYDEKEGGFSDFLASLGKNQRKQMAAEWGEEWDKDTSLAPTKKLYIDRKFRDLYDQSLKESTREYISKHKTLKKERKGSIDFDKIFGEQKEAYDTATSIESPSSAPHYRDIFGNREIVITGSYEKQFKDFFNYIRETKSIDDIGFNDTELRKFVSFCSQLPSKFETGNKDLDLFIDYCRNKQYSIFNKKSWDYQVFREAYRAIKFIDSERKKKKYKKSINNYTNGDIEKAEKAIYDILNEDDAIEDYDDRAYKEYKGADFFDKLSKAKGFDKLGVIHAGARHAIGKPLNWALRKFDTLTNVLGRTISGDIGAITDLFPSIEGMAFGGTVKKPGLYALSPGEQVIPAYLNPFNPARGIADPFRDIRRETRTIEKAKGMGISVEGGRALGTDVRDKQSIMDRIRTQFAPEEINMEDINFRNIVKNWFRKYNKDLTPEELKFVENAIDTNDPDKLNISITSITAAEIIERAKKGADFVYGNAKDLGKKALDLLPPSIKDNLQEIGKYGAWGAVAGVASGMIGGPFGIVGGALIGSATGFIHHSQSAKDILFGPNLGENLKTFLGGKNGARYAAIGGTVGGLLGGPFGVVGGSMLGAGYSFLESSERFQKIMFGNKGIVARIDHFFGKGFSDTRKSLIDYIKEAIVNPIDRAIVPVGTALQVGFKKTFEIVDKGLRNLVKPTFAELTNKIFGKYKDNKYFTGALGGAAGGALMGGPVGAILGGVVGSVAHGTGFDKKLTELGKLPGKMLDQFSGYLARTEIESGNAYNWTAQERIAKMKELNKGEDTYLETARGKLDLKLSKSSRGELVRSEMILRMAVGDDPELDSALKKAYWHLDRAMAISGVDNWTKEEILNTIKENTFTFTLDDAEKILNDDRCKMSTENKKSLLLPEGQFVEALDEYKAIAKFVDDMKKKSHAEQMAYATQQLGGVTDKSALNKSLKYVSKQRQALDRKYDELDVGAKITTTSALLDQTDLVSKKFERTFTYYDALLYQLSHPGSQVKVNSDGAMTITESEKGQNKKEVVTTTTTFSPDGTKIVKTDTIGKDGKIKSSKEEFFDRYDNKIANPKGAESLNAANANTKEEIEALKAKEREEAQKQQMVDSLTLIADNAKEEMQTRKALSKIKSAAGTVAGGIGKALSSIIGLPIKMIDGIMN